MAAGRILALAFVALLLHGGAASATEYEPRLTFTAPDPGVRAVALTFDACSGAFDQRVMDALVETKARATIFMTDRWARKNAPALTALKAHADLFQIENHGAQHIPAVTDAARVFGVKTAATIEGVRAEIEGGAKAVEAATGRRPVWYRGATARYTPDALLAIRQMGFRVAGYSVNADMGASLPARSVERRFEAARTGDVLIAHINQPGKPAGEGAAAGIRTLARSGVRFVRLDEVETKSQDGPAILAARHEVKDQLDVQRHDDGRDKGRDDGHPARRDEVPHLGPARGEPDQRKDREGQLKAQHDLTQDK